MLILETLSSELDSTKKEMQCQEGLVSCTAHYRVELLKQAKVSSIQHKDLESNTRKFNAQLESVIPSNGLCSSHSHRVNALLEIADKRCQDPVLVHSRNSTSYHILIQHIVV